MIYTVTLNPSLDYMVFVPDFQPGKVNRTESEYTYPGGKGINVSIVLSHLGCDSTALGFLAGFTGVEIERRLRAQNIRTEFIPVGEGMSRINVKLRTDRGVTEETEINGKGPVVEETALKRLMDRVEGLEEGDTLVLAGSIPSSVPDTIYRDICRLLSGRGIHIVVDTTGKALLQVLEYHPFLIKPNHHELGALFEVELHTRDDVVVYARKLQEMGARNVLVSLGGEGAVLVAEDGSLYTAPAPQGQVVNAVGAGDSMVAGFLAGLEGQREEGMVDYKEAFILGLCAGSASAFSEELATAESVRRLRAEMKGIETK